MPTVASRGNLFLGDCLRTLKFLLRDNTLYRGWSGQDLRHIVLNCFINEYKPETVILGNETSMNENIFFVISGTCEIVRVSIQLMFFLLQ